MKTLKQMLAGKRRPLAVVAPNDSVFHALTLMAQHDVGALAEGQLDGGALAGVGLALVLLAEVEEHHDDVGLLAPRQREILGDELG